MLSLSLMKKAFIQLHVAVFLAGFTAILGRLIELQEGWLVLYRMLITVLLLMPYLGMKGNLRVITPQKLLPVLGTGFIISLHWLTFYASVKYANASVALVCLAASGIFSALFEPLIIKRPFHFREIVFGMMGIGGIYIIFNFNPEYKVGIIFGLLSAIGSALFPIFNKRLLTIHPARLLTFYEMIGGGICLAMFLPIYFSYFPAAYFIPTGKDLFLLLILSSLCTVVAFNLQLSALRVLSAFTSNLTYLLEPVYGIVLALFFLGEGRFLGPSFYFGLGLAASAVGLQMWFELKSKALESKRMFEKSTEFEKRTDSLI